MNLLHLHAIFECEGCPAHFTIELPFDAVLGPRECLMDAATKQLRSSPHGPSYIAETTLCGACTCAIDAKRLKHPDGKKHRDELTRLWILQALDAIA